MATNKLFEKEEIAVYPKQPNLPMAIQGLDDSLFFTTYQGGTDLNYQVNYAFNNDAYVYVFGEKLSMSRISGIAFPTKACKGTKMESTPKKFVEFFNTYKLGSLKAVKPLRIAMGGMTLSGYFTNLSINLVANKQSTYTFTFTFLGRVN